MFRFSARLTFRYSCQKERYIKLQAAVYKQDKNSAASANCDPQVYSIFL